LLKKITVNTILNQFCIEERFKIDIKGMIRIDRTTTGIKNVANTIIYF